ncbi:TRANSLATION FACTOR [Salix purpurea]|uniref:TRANSLATION FACTOR n=1 Tax=Salix purpurea TaxID=77065 RepID=A0A9Q0V9F8_SALPP|nr:TRANSLATION FACTOR [Salix purpurea]
MAEAPLLDIEEEVRSLQLDSAASEINGVINTEDARPEEVEKLDEMEKRFTIDSDSNDKVTVSSQEVQAELPKVKDKEVPAPEDVEALVEVEQDNKKRHLNVVFIGHVDAGKSTTGGQILFLSGQVDDRTIQKYEKEAKDKSRESCLITDLQHLVLVVTLYMAYIMDTNEEERVKGKTVEVGRAYFETETTRFTILDAPMMPESLYACCDGFCLPEVISFAMAAVSPNSIHLSLFFELPQIEGGSLLRTSCRKGLYVKMGHKSYVPNMISGASQADIGVLVISARKGEFETGYERGGQTREHVQLAKTLGVSKLLVVVNKMDEPTVNWSKERYDEIESKMIPFLKSSGYNVKERYWRFFFYGLKLLKHDLL